MKFLSKIKYFIVAFTLTVLSLPVSSAEAKSTNISVSPGFEQITLQPGETYKSSFKVYNLTNTDETSKFNISVSPITISGEEYDTFSFNTKNQYNQMADWVTIGEKSGELAPGEELIVPFTIDVPTNTPAGGQYAAIRVTEAESTEASTQSEVLSLGEFAFVIYANVAGETNLSGSIKSNDVSSFYFDPVITTTSIVENTGNAHSEATYIMRIFPLFSDEELYSNEEEPETHLILPESTRFIALTYGNGDGQSISFPGIYRVEQEVSFLNDVSTTSKIVIVCPMWLLLLVAFAIVFLVIWLVLRNKNRKAASKNNKGKTTGKSSTTHATHAAHNSEKPDHKSDSKPDSPESD